MAGYKEPWLQGDASCVLYLHGFYSGLFFVFFFPCKNGLLLLEQKTAAWISQ